MNKYVYFFIGYMTAIITIIMASCTISPLQADYDTPGQTNNIKMGRITEFFDYIRSKFEPEEELYSHLSVNERIKKSRQKYLKTKRETK